MTASKASEPENEPSGRAEPVSASSAGLHAASQVSDGRITALPSPRETQAPGLARLAETARDYAAARSSANTSRAYASDWAQFQRFCRRKGFDPAEPDPQVVGLFLAAMASGDGAPQAAVSTIERRLAAITTTYRSAGSPLPRQDRHIIDVMAGIRRLHARPPVKKAALFAEDILAMCATLPQDLRGYRDRAMLLVGFAGALRRSEITGLDCGAGQTQDSGGWIAISDEGALLTVRGKTGWRNVEIGRGSSPTTCPVAALERWLSLARISHGPVFRRVREQNRNVGPDRLNDAEVARLVKRAALAAGVRADLPEAERKALFGGHSLRSGFASSAAVDEAYIQKQLGHASAEMTRGYRQQKERFRVNLTRAAGL
jgi:integrase